jgi:hypothetical protein
MLIDLSMIATSFLPPEPKWLPDCLIPRQKGCFAGKPGQLFLELNVDLASC